MLKRILLGVFVKFNVNIKNYGEELAVSYLKKNGYSIVERNFRSIYGEIDIIARKNSTIVFVEVRQLSNPLIEPSLTVNLKKQKKIKLTAMMYLKKNGIKASEHRFDVISIRNKEIQHIENAFE